VVGNLLVINVAPREERVALIENGRTVELHVAHSHERGLVGNIYKGKVARVLPGMQAAFIELGLERSAFLYVDEARDSDDTSILLDDELATEADGVTPVTPAPPVPPVPIQAILREGQEIVVQVQKDPIGTKGARLTTQLTFPGRMLVYMPSVPHTGISRRIEDPDERERLRAMLLKLRAELTGERGGAAIGGFIARTAASEATEDQLRADMLYLMALAEDVQTRSKGVRAPTLLHRDHGVAVRAVRDLLSPSVEKVLVDDPATFEEVAGFIEQFLPERRDALELYTGREPIFDQYGVEAAVAQAQQRKVWLRSGGYIVLDEAEALTAIDVNTGRFVGRHNLEDTITKTNLEAVDEIVAQLRLRNIGGIIIIDFIDMDQPLNRDRVFKALGDALARDRVKSSLVKISELGLVEMTRKRVRESLGRTLAEPCTYCEGRGHVKTARTVAAEIFRELTRQVGAVREPKILIKAHPDVAEFLTTEVLTEEGVAARLAGKSVLVRSEAAFHREQFQIRGTLEDTQSQPGV
jgi:ribonuclease G